MRILMPFVLAFFLSLVSFADDSNKTWVDKKGSAVRSVKLSNGADGGKGIQVTLNHDKEKLPTSIGITFFNSSGNPVSSFELKSMDIMNDSAQYHGIGTSFPESYMGFELRIPFGGSTQVVRSEDLEPVRTKN